jgi:OOP family OmpA-OmpF porin
VTQKVTLSGDALFDTGKADLKPNARSALDDLVGKLAGVKLEVLVVVGHTDSTGAAALNDRLSLRRADAVKTYLASKGIEANRIYTEGKGARQPIADNKTAQGRQQNRRVEIEVVGTKTSN